MCGGVDLLRICIYEYTCKYIFFTKKNVTRILSVFRWDVSCGEVLGKIQSQVVPWMGGFIIIVLENLDEN